MRFVFRTAGPLSAVRHAGLRGWLAGGAGQLDEQTRSRQRGGPVGRVTVAATPAPMPGNGVTLWDEIAPPTPLPMPADVSQQAAQAVRSIPGGNGVRGRAVNLSLVCAGPRTIRHRYD